MKDLYRVDVNNFTVHMPAFLSSAYFSDRPSVLMKSIDENTFKLKFPIKLFKFPNFHGENIATRIDITVVQIFLKFYICSWIFRHFSRMWPNLEKNIQYLTDDR